MQIIKNTTEIIPKDNRRKILLLTDMPPTKDFTAGIVLDHLCGFLPKDSFVCFCILDKDLNPTVSSDLGDFPITFYTRPRERWPRLHGFGKFLAFVCESYSELYKAPLIVQKAVAFGKQHKVSCVWVVLQGQTMIRVALPVARRLHAPLFSQIWDPPDWGLKASNIDRFTRYYLFRKFKNILRASSACATASWNMKNTYEKQFGVKCVPILPSIDERLIEQPKKNREKNKDVIIGFSGQLYATDCWSALLTTLKKLDWKIANRKVKIRLIGRYFFLSSDGVANIEYLGWRSQKETIALLKECDLLYCPYWFDEAFDIVARLSFPSKLVTYFASTRPVFFHGPDASSPGKFMKRYKTGYCCNSLEAKDIIRGLLQLVSDERKSSQYIENAHAIAKERFTLRSLQKSFSMFLNVSEKHI